MTRKYLWLVLCAALLLFAACQKAPELTITSPASIELSADGSNGTITFTANRDWKVSSSDSWVTVSPTSGEASDKAVTVSVRCNANTTYEDRTATITIRMEELSQTVTVRQSANKGVVLPRQTFDLQADTRSIDVEIQANVQYTVSTSVNWIKQIGTKGLTSKTLTFSVEENKTYDPREGKITIKPQESGVQEQVISVRQAQKDALVVEKTSYDMPYGGGEVEVKVESNVSFDVTPSADWIHYVQTKALSNSTVVLKIDENTTYSPRQGTVEIKQQNGTLKHTVTINQAEQIAVTSVELNKTSINLKEGESETLVATVKPDNATDKTVTWSSSDETIASVESGKVTAIKEGKATITAKAGEKSATCTINVTSSSIPEGNIVFADSGIKAKLVAAFDSNGDGELSYAEAAAVQSLRDVFGGETSFTSFDEYQYFIGLSIVDHQLFNGWSQLKSIILPDSITEIGVRAFNNCINLGMVKIPSKTVRIDDYAFYGCSNMSGQLYLPDGFIAVGSYAFAGCIKLNGDLLFPESNQAQLIGTYAFSNCAGLNGNLVLPKNNPLYVQAYAFTGCSFSGDLVVGANVDVQRFGFYGIKVAGSLYLAGEDPTDYAAFESVEIGENLIIQDDVKWLSQNPFYNATIGGYLYLGQSLVSLSSSCFTGAAYTKVYVAAQTPPNCNNGLYLTGRYLGVPIGRLDVYKATSPWNQAETIEEVDFTTLKTTP